MLTARQVYPQSRKNMDKACDHMLDEKVDGIASRIVTHGARRERRVWRGEAAMGRRAQEAPATLRLVKIVRRMHSRSCPTRGSAMLKRLEKYAVGAAFDAEDVRILTAAFDDAWKCLQDSGVVFASDGHADATREILALRIIEMAQLGERDQRRLRDDALLHLAQSDLRSSGL
jgi:hypothetical protein